jgi:hypothetical protein
MLTFVKMSSKNEKKLAEAMAVGITKKKSADKESFCHESGFVEFLYTWWSEKRSDDQDCGVFCSISLRQLNQSVGIFIPLPFDNRMKRLYPIAFWFVNHFFMKNEDILNAKI